MIRFLGLGPPFSILSNLHLYSKLILFFSLKNGLQNNSLSRLLRRRPKDKFLPYRKNKKITGNRTDGSWYISVHLENCIWNIPIFSIFR